MALLKIGVVGFGNRIAHVFFELNQINKDAKLVAFVDPKPIGKKFAVEKNFFPSNQYDSLNEMINHVFGPLQRIRVSLFADTLEFSSENSKSSIFILFN